MNKFLQFFKFILKRIFPDLCICCNSEFFNLEDNGICKICSHYFEEIDKNFMCQKCSYPFYFEGEKVDCANCSRINFSFEFTRSIYIYNDIIKKLITDIKYNDETASVRIIVNSFFQIINNNKIDFEIIAAVPMFKDDILHRKYNQSALFGLYLSEKFQDKLFIPDLLLKNKKTKKSTNLSSEERLKLNHYIEFNPQFLDFIENKSILILDDVMTTGSTLQACSLAIKKMKKNNRIYCLTFARTVL